METQVSRVVLSYAGDQTVALCMVKSGSSTAHSWAALWLNSSWHSGASCPSPWQHCATCQFQHGESCRERVWFQDGSTACFPASPEIGADQNGASSSVSHRASCQFAASLMERNKPQWRECWRLAGQPHKGNRTRSPCLSLPFLSPCGSSQRSCRVSKPSLGLTVRGAWSWVAVLLPWKIYGSRAQDLGQRGLTLGWELMAIHSFVWSQDAGMGVAGLNTRTGCAVGCNSAIGKTNYLRL